jgi:hypothetical protein
MDSPWLDCLECRNLHERDAQVFGYPCALCPNVLLAASGEVGRLAYEAAVLLSQAPNPEHPPSWELIFEMLGVASGALKRRIYEYVALWARLQKAHDEALKPENLKTVTNPNV